MIGTSTSAMAAMRLMPPNTIRPITPTRMTPLIQVGRPKVSCIEVATVKDCTALKPKPKVTSSRIEKITASQR
ncbi:hypothetical protein D3C81_1891870 [compost metagenome]